MKLCAEAMGGNEFDETAFREQIACIHITAPFQLSIHFLDGHTIEAKWENKRKMPKHSDERKQHMREKRRIQYAVFLNSVSYLKLLDFFRFSLPHTVPGLLPRKRHCRLGEICHKQRHRCLM